jgi:hypothetical protein
MTLLPPATTQPPHPYFLPFKNKKLERLAKILYEDLWDHEMEVAGCVKEILPWDLVEPDMQRGYRAMAVAAYHFFYKENSR